MDFSGSSGSGGRPWASVTLTASTENAELDALLSSAPFRAGLASTLSATVPGNMLAPDDEHTFTVTMCNFMDVCSTRLHGVMVMLSDEFPVARTLGADVRDVRVDQSVSIQGEAHIALCSGLPTSQGFTYVWTVLSVEGQVKTEQPHLRSVSNMASRFWLPAFSLVSDTNYEVVLTATHSFSSHAVATRVLLYTPRTSIQVVVDGELERSIRPDTEFLRLDASSSYDGDFPELGYKAAGLDFAWDCELVVTEDDFEPMAGARDEGCGVKIKLATRRGAFVTAIYTEWSAGTSSRVTVSVSHSASGRVSSKTILLHAESNRHPVVRLLGTTPDVTSGRKVNTQSKFSIRATVDYSSADPNDAGACVWSISPALPGAALRAAVRTPLSTGLPALVSPNVTGSVPITFVMIRNTLIAGMDFAFVLSCGMASGLSTQTYVGISTNGAPRPGTFAVAPSNGTEFLTVFVFTARSWEDDDLPLSFDFGFSLDGLGDDISASAPAPDKVSLVTQRLELPNARTQLPAGRAGREHIVSTQVAVYDSLDASAVAYDDVAVAPMVFTDASSGGGTGKNEQEQKSEALLSIAESSLTALSVDLSGMLAAQQLIATVSAALNTVNCTLTFSVNGGNAAASVSGNCSALNRRPCAETAHTCGPCLDTTFIGEAGDANSMCVAPLFAFAEVRDGTGSGRGSDGNTVQSVTEEGLRSSLHAASNSSAMVTALTAIRRLKACPSDCSGRGHCAFRYTGMAPNDVLRRGPGIDAQSEMLPGPPIELYRPGTPPPDPVQCMLSDKSCEAYCQCGPGFAGRACSYSPAELVTRQNTRELMIERMVNDSSYADPEIDDFLRRTRTITALTNKVLTHGPYPPSTPPTQLPPLSLSF
jgi:hypothetical protein